MKKNLKNKKKGFTLIELIIVIAIIAIIAAIAIPRFGSVTNDAKLKADIANAKTIANAVTMAIAEGDPAFASDITTKTEVDDTLLGAYLQAIPKTSGNDPFSITVVGGDVVVYDADGNQVYPQ